MSPGIADFEIGRRRAKHVAWAAAALIIAALGVAGYLQMRPPAPAPQAPATKVVIALSNTPHPALLQVADARGYFREEGLDVEIVLVAHGKAAIDLVRAGKANLATASEAPTVLALLDAAPLSIVASVYSASRSTAIVARRDRGIRAGPDLAGKNVAVTFGTAGEYFLWTYCLDEQVEFNRLHLVDLPPSRLVQALKTGAVDAVATWQPNLANAQAALGNDSILLTGQEIYSESHLLLASTDFAKTHPQALVAVVRALLKAEHYLQSGPAEAMRLMAAKMGVGVEELRPWWNDIVFRVRLDQSLFITLEDVAHWAIARGYAKPGSEPNFLRHVYLDALLAVEPSRVSVIRQEAR